jgi:hypothetical protein
LIDPSRSADLSSTYDLSQVRAEANLTFLDRVYLTAASLLSFGFAHADLAEDSAKRTFRSFGERL